MSLRKAILSLSVCLPGLFPTTAICAPSLYVLGLNTSNNPVFGTLDLTLGAFSSIGLSGVPAGSVPRCLGYASNGLLYAQFVTTSNNSSNTGLYTMNPSNGSATSIATIPGAIGACAMTASGVMYGLTSTGGNFVLYSVNLSTGAPSQIGTILPALSSFRIALTALNNTLYLALQSSTAPNSTLYTVNTSTGTATSVGSTDGGVVGLASSSGGLYAFTYPVFDTTPAHIDTISLTNGASTLVAKISPPTYITGGLPINAPSSSNTTPSITSLDNGASFAPKSTAAPGAFLTLKATGLGSVDSLGVFPATQSNGVSVIINGIAAPIFDLDATDGSVNLFAPIELPTSGTVPVQLKTNAGASSVFTLNMAAAVPAMFGLTDPGKPARRNAVAVDAATSSIAMPVSMAEAIAKALGIPPDCTAASPAAYCGHPASAGDTITVYATGLGIATPNGDPAGTPLATGQVAPIDGSVVFNTIATPVVMIGGAPATVTSSTLALGLAGIYQIAIQIPTSAPSGDDVPITLSVPGSSTDTATIAIQ